VDQETRERARLNRKERRVGHCRQSKKERAPEDRKREGDQWELLYIVPNVRGQNIKPGCSKVLSIHNSRPLHNGGGNKLGGCIQIEDGVRRKKWGQGEGREEINSYSSPRGAAGHRKEGKPG